MSLDQLIDLIIANAPYFLTKIIITILSFLHVLFSLVITRQTQSMIQVVEAKISPVILAIAVIHLLASILVFLWVIIFI